MSTDDGKRHVSEIAARLNELTEQREEAMEAMHKALMSYRPSWIHPGSDPSPTRLPDPEWVLLCQAAIRRMERNP